MVYSVHEVTSPLVLDENRTRERMGIG